MGSVATTSGGADIALFTPFLLTTASGIDGKVVANTVIWTNTSSRTAYVNSMQVRCTAATAITVVPTVSLGSVATNDIYVATVLTGQNATGLAFGFASVGLTHQVASGASLTFAVTAGATATTDTLAVDVFGYYV